MPLTLYVCVSAEDVCGHVKDGGIYIERENLPANCKLGTVAQFHYLPKLQM